jgi:hypothetical protein
MLAVVKKVITWLELAFGQDLLTVSLALVIALVS